MAHRDGARAALFALVTLIAACTPFRGAMSRLPGPAIPCRVPTSTAAPALPTAGSPRIDWLAPSPPEHRARLDAWCGAAGPPVIAPPSRTGAAALATVRAATRPGRTDELTIVAWNVHAGTGDIAGLIRRLRAGEFTSGRPARFIVLLQEAIRGGPVVPRVVLPGGRTPRAAGVGSRQTDIVQLADTLGLWLYYVPSMRNGTPARSDQDRGNAILSSEPLSDFAAIELPFEHQRRVAVQASVSGEDRRGRPWTLRVVSAHLESTVPATRLWVFANGARVRQAQALLAALGPAGPLVLAGDFNTWFGFADPAYQTIADVIPGIARDERRATFGRFFRLDHMFARLGDEWTATARRLDQRFGSDHFPLVAQLRRRGDQGERLVGRLHE